MPLNELDPDGPAINSDTWQGSSYTSLTNSIRLMPSGITVARKMQTATWVQVTFVWPLEL